MEDLIGPASDPRVGPSGAATEPLRHNSAAAGIYALGVIELLDGQPVSRSPAYLVRFPHTQPSTESSE
jgi:hypothetical protein